MGNERIPMQIAEFVEYLPKALYEALGKKRSVEIGIAQILPGPGRKNECRKVPEFAVVSVDMGKGVEPAVYSVAREYLRYADAFGCDELALVEDIARDAEWYASEIENDEELEVGT